MQHYFSLHDTMAGRFLPVWSAPTLFDGLRAISQSLADSKHFLSQRPQDYILVRIGEFDEDTGMFTCKPRQFVSVPNIAADLDNSFDAFMSSLKRDGVK